jgi:hypothetical protein
MKSTMVGHTLTPVVALIAVFISTSADTNTGHIIINHLKQLVKPRDWNINIAIADTIAEGVNA